MKQHRPKKPQAKRDVAFHALLALQTAPYLAGVNRMRRVELLHPAQFVVFGLTVYSFCAVLCQLQPSSSACSSTGSFRRPPPRRTLRFSARHITRRGVHRKEDHRKRRPCHRHIPQIRFVHPKALHCECALCGKLSAGFAKKNQVQKNSRLFSLGEAESESNATYTADTLQRAELQ